MIVRENLGQSRRTGYCFKFKGEILYRLGCWQGNYEDTLKAVSGKYGNNSDYENAIRNMQQEALEKL